MLGSHIIRRAMAKMADAIRAVVPTNVAVAKTEPDLIADDQRRQLKSGRGWYQNPYAHNFSGAKLQRRAAAGTVGRARLK